MKHFFKKLVVTIALGHCCISAIDLPVRYKTGPLNMTTCKNTDNWITTIQARYGQSTSNNGYDYRSHKTSALDIFGQTNLERLGFGIVGLTGNTMPNTSNLWQLGYDPSAQTGFPGPYNNPGGPLSAVYPVGAVAGPFDTGAIANLVKTTGRVSVSELSFTVEQNLVAGFFAQCFIPIRQLTVNRIGYTVIGSQNMPVYPGGFVVAPGVALYNQLTGGTNLREGNANTFMDVGLMQVMQEHGMQLYRNDYTKSAVPEVLIGVGWQGFNDKGFGVIDDATGRVFVAALLPGGGMQDNSYMTGFPVGYNGFWGVHTRLELEVGFKKYLAFGLSSSINIFLADDRTMRVMSDTQTQQQGLLSLVKARVGVDQGAVWDVCGFVKLHKAFYGLVGQLGYSFTKQEATNVIVKDSNYLSTAKQQFLASAPFVAVYPNSPQFLNVDTIANADQRLKSWERQVLYCSIGYDFGLHNPAPFLAPYIGFEFGCPVDGRRVMNGNYYGGTASLQLKIGF